MYNYDFYNEDLWNPRELLQGQFVQFIPTVV